MKPTVRAVLVEAFGVEGVVRRVRERRQRGTRIALDWKYSHSFYLFVPTAILGVAFGGLDLMGKEPQWQRVAGALLLLSAIVVAGLIGKWLLRPVDPDSRERLDQYYEKMAWHPFRRRRERRLSDRGERDT